MSFLRHPHEEPLGITVGHNRMTGYGVLDPMSIRFRGLAFVLMVS